VRYAEARRPARVDAEGVMIPLSQQDPKLWRRGLIEEGDHLLASAMKLCPRSSRTLQAALQAIWCARRDVGDPAPWPQVLGLYDQLLALRDDAIVRLNRIVALAEVAGPSAALHDLNELAGEKLENFAPYQAVRADLLARVGRIREAGEAYQAALALEPPAAERRWLSRRLTQLRREGNCQ
jgi:RNA polymerase sigma-70 factor (ECF subfamily)